MLAMEKIIEPNASDNSTLKASEVLVYRTISACVLNIRKKRILTGITTRNACFNLTISVSFNVKLNRSKKARYIAAIQMTVSKINTSHLGIFPCFKKFVIKENDVSRCESMEKNKVIKKILKISVSMNTSWKKITNKKISFFAENPQKLSNTTKKKKKF